jgi:hypothetical protein
MRFKIKDKQTHVVPKEMLAQWTPPSRNARTMDAAIRDRSDTVLLLLYEGIVGHFLEDGGRSISVQTVGLQYGTYTLPAGAIGRKRIWVVGSWLDGWWVIGVAYGAVLRKS